MVLVELSPPAFRGMYSYHLSRTWIQALKVPTGVPQPLTPQTSHQGGISGLQKGPLNSSWHWLKVEVSGLPLYPSKSALGIG